MLKIFWNTNKVLFFLYQIWLNFIHGFAFFRPIYDFHMLCDLRSFTVIIFTLSTLLFDLYNLRVYKKSFLYAVVEIDIKCELFPLKSLQVHMWIKTLNIVVRTLHGVLNKNYDLKDWLSFCNCIWKPFFNWISRFSLTK